LKHLPSALIKTAEFDVLRDEGKAYAARLKDEGNEVTLIRMNGVPHTFQLYDAVQESSTISLA
jgi:acetyl esterase